MPDAVVLDEVEALKLRARMNARRGAGDCAPGKLTPGEVSSLVRDFIEEDITYRALADRYGVKPPTVRYHIRRALRAAEQKEERADG